MRHFIYIKIKFIINEIIGWDWNGMEWNGLACVVKNIKVKKKW